MTTKGEKSDASKWNVDSRLKLLSLCLYITEKAPPSELLAKWLDIGVTGAAVRKQIFNARKAIEGDEALFTQVKAWKESNGAVKKTGGKREKNKSKAEMEENGREPVAKKRKRAEREVKSGDSTEEDGSDKENKETLEPAPKISDDCPDAIMNGDREGEEAKEEACEN